jgi:hypothetical protein
MITATLSSPWVLSLMLALHAKEPVPLPWIDFLAPEAEAIAEDASRAPLPGMTKELTAALETVMAWRESRFRPDAIHDKGAGYGLFGIQRATLGREVPEDVVGQVGALRELMAMSFRICADRPVEEKLGWYMAGREGCDRRLGLSRARVWEAERLLRAHPPPKG